MITIEQVEKLRQYGNISFEDAKRALEATDGNILDAVIMLEKEGKINSPQNGGTVHNQSTQQTATPPPQSGQEKFESYAKRFFSWCGRVIHKGNVNTFDVMRNNQLVISVPVTILIVLTIFFFWVIVPLIIVGLFFNYHYLFKGPDLGKDSVNNVANEASKVAEDIKNSVKDM